MQQGKAPYLTGREIGGNRFAPLGAMSCGGRGKVLQRACECLAACAERVEYLGCLLRQREVMDGASYFVFPQCGVFAAAKLIEVALGRMVFQS